MPIWRKILNTCHLQNENDIETPSPILKPPSPCNEPQNKDSPIAHSNQLLPQPHSLSLIDPYIASILQLLSPPPPQGDNQTQPQPPPSLSREMRVDEINQLQDFSNLLAMYLQNHTTNSLPPTPSTPSMPHTITLNQVKHHAGYYPCCHYNQTQFIFLRKDLNWIEYLLTRPYPPLQVPRNYPTTTTSVSNSPPPNPTV
uniref:Uncharacterized protein n=1 Tax=Tanacetum cinerariifolium TaxID=118510 RepID=A0A6L2JS52_TANCI|nr:hypothetical protein [Tanacetum cinerariifolium]